MRVRFFSPKTCRVGSQRGSHTWPIIAWNPISAMTTAMYIYDCASLCVYYADPFKFGPSVCISECAQSALISIDIFLSGKKEERTRKRKEVGRQGERVVDGLERADSAEGTRSLLHTPVVAAAAHPHTFLSGQTHKSPSSYPLCFFVSLLSPFNPSSTLSLD